MNIRIDDLRCAWEKCFSIRIQKSGNPNSFGRFGKRDLFFENNDKRFYNNKNSNYPMKKIFFLFLLHFIGSVIFAQDSLRFLSATTGAACYQVEYYNNYLFAGTGTTLRVYNVSGNLPYQMLFEYRFRSIILDLKVKNNFLYVAANHDGISKWDISTISNPIKLYEYLPDSLNEAAHDIAFYGDTLFVAYYKKVGVFFDNGTSFQKLTTFGHLSGNGYIAGGDLKDTVYAYTVGRNGATDGIYFRNARTLSFISYFPQTFAAPEDVVFGESIPLLHVLGGTQNAYNPFDSRGFFYSLNITNIYSPQLAFADTLPGFIGLAIAGPLNAVNKNDTIYVATNCALEPGWVFPNPAYGQVYVYEATNPSNVNFLTSIYAGLWHFDLDINNDILYVASEWYGIETIDISNIYNEVNIGNTLTGGWAMKGDKYGNTLILANEGYGFKKFDISNISRPTLIAVATYTTNAPGFCQEVKFSANGNYIYGLFQTYEQFRIYDATTLALVSSIQNIGGVGYGTADMLVEGNKVYIDANTGGGDLLRVIDISNPAAPFIDVSIQINANDMQMKNGKLFLCNNDGIYIYDVSSGSPNLLTSRLLSAGIQDAKKLAVINDTIFAFVTWKGLVRYIYNSNLNTITEDATVVLINGEPQAMAVDSFGLYVAWTKFGLYAYDKQSLTQTGWYRTGLDLKGHPDIWPVTDLFCKDNLIFLNEYFGQTTILTMDWNIVTVEENFVTHPSFFESFFNYPNPFNSTTIIRFSLSNPEQVTLKIFDILGREIATLADGRMNAGEYSVSFDARGVPSGVYFYRIYAGKFTDVKKMMLVR